MILVRIISANNIYVNSIKIKTGENLSLSDLSGVDSSLFSNINNNDILMFAGGKWTKGIYNNYNQLHCKSHYKDLSASDIGGIVLRGRM